MDEARRRRKISNGLHNGKLEILKSNEKLHGKAVFRHNFFNV